MEAADAKSGVMKEKSRGRSQQERICGLASSFKRKDKFAPEQQSQDLRRPAAKVGGAPAVVTITVTWRGRLTFLAPTTCKERRV